MKVSILIDEAGTLPDPKDTIVIIAAVGIEMPTDLVDVFKKTRKKIRARKTFDKHFHRNVDQEKFNEILQKLLNKRLLLRHVDSKENPMVNTADMAAGSALWAYAGKQRRFYDLIKKNIISEKILNWKEAKRKFFERIKNLTRTDASVHPK